VLRASGAVERVEIGGTLLGVLPEPALPEVDLELGVGDSLVLYTDGVTEARGADGAQFGESGLIDVLSTLTGALPGEVADRISAAVDAFQAGPPSDDRAIVVARVSD
jgi:serine phosphatase RsbU (regulator of sigma subunit)